MRNDILTSDNLQLSRVTLNAKKPKQNEMQLIALNDLDVRGSDDEISTEVADLLGYSLSANTGRAYRADLDHFLAWGGSIPATPGKIGSYVADQAGRLSVATIRRRIATLSKVHESSGLANPCRSEMVKATLRGLARKHGSAQKQARPLLRDDLFLVLDKMASSIRDRRDRALFLLGFAGGFRRSELVGLEVGDIEPVRQGLVVTLRGSKTDQERVGRKIGIRPSESQKMLLPSSNTCNISRPTSMTDPQ